MHNGQIVIWYPAIVDVVFQPKLIFSTIFDVFFVDGDILVSIWPALFVIEAYRVANLMFNTVTGTISFVQTNCLMFGKSENNKVRNLGDRVGCHAQKKMEVQVR